MNKTIPSVGQVSSFPSSKPTTVAPRVGATQARLAARRSRMVREKFIEFLLFLAALSSVATTTAILFILVSESLPFFAAVPLKDILFDTQWTPLFDDAHYGIGVLLSGTLVSSAVALAVAIPLGTVIALYLSEFAPFSVREVAKPILERRHRYPTGP